MTHAKNVLEGKTFRTFGKDNSVILFQNSFVPKIKICAFAMLVIAHFAMSPC